MSKFEIRYALGGGFGGTDEEEWEEIEADSIDIAEKAAWFMACEVYDSFEGAQGIRNIDDIMEEDECPEEEATEIWRDERESGLNMKQGQRGPNPRRWIMDESQIPMWIIIIFVLADVIAITGLLLVLVAAFESVEALGENVSKLFRRRDNG